MNFVKGMIFGTMVSAGIMMMYTEGKGMNKKNIMKKASRPYFRGNMILARMKIRY